MTTSTMHFGPEWMRTKGSARPAPSPPLTMSPAPPGTSTYSALVTPVTASAPERRDISNPFRYSREEMLRIYKEGGGRGGLGLEVERWEGIVREVGYDPVGLKEMSEAEKKIFAGSLNSEIRRRQSTDVLSPLTTSLGDRPKLGHAAPATNSPMRERIGNLMMRRRDSTDQTPLPRKLSLSSVQGPLASPREAALPSPRTRIGIAPGFDGVLSESWSSRRRFAENASKPSADSSTRKDREPSDSGPETKGPHIRDNETGGRDSEQLLNDHPQVGPQSNGIAASEVSSVGQSASGSLNAGMAIMSLAQEGENAPPEVSGADRSPDNSINRPPGLADPASVEWSYLDPQGQVQGPFRADIMQRWHEEGYFSVNLLMKRTHLDTEWISVGEMLRRAGGRPIFLTPDITTVAPPGLPHRLDPLLEGSVSGSERSSPFQPGPAASLRTSTLDPYLQNGSSASASPSSSFSAAKFVNGSPDPSAFEARTTNHIFAESPVGPRLGGFTSITGSPAAGVAQRRATFNDTFDSGMSLRPSFTNASNGRTMTVDSLGFTGIDGPVSATEPASPFTSSFSAADRSLNGHAGSSGQSNAEFDAFRTMNGQGPHLLNRDVYSRAAMDDVQSPYPLGGMFVNGTGSFPPNGQHYAQNQTLQYTSQDGHSLTSLTSLPDRQSTIPSHTPSSNHQLHSIYPATPGVAGTQSQWPPQGAPGSRRIGPFDADYPTAQNTLITGTTTVAYQPFGHSSQSARSNDQSPWLATPPQNVNGSGVWAGDTSRLTTANLGHHNQQQQEEAHTQNLPIPTEIATAQTQNTGVVNHVPKKSGDVDTIVPTISTPPIEVPGAGQKSRRKSTAQSQSTPAAPQTVPSKPLNVSAAAASLPSPQAPSESKAAWGVDDESKTVKPTGVTLGLREIQEAEIKKLEARKAAERERERAARVANGSASQAEDLQPFTATWGLPTSQAGTARTPAVAKDPSSTTPSATSPAAPVWTNTPKPQVVKKSMKEIQEEEERRKKQASEKKETVAAAAKRGYAETTTKSTPTAQPTGGAWTTVGSGGKSSGTTTPTISRPAISTSNSSAKVVPIVSTNNVVQPSASVRVAPASVVASRPSTVTKNSSVKADDFPTPPSHDFLKWLGDSLKGLNNTINFEEITSMLLSFPLDPDPSTIEIISDLIYASSTTLDGRRFASEFVSRRKVDAASRAKNGAPASAPAKPLSIAEVVKTQPKPAQSEWGGFKVVNKKKRGGKA